MGIEWDDTPHYYSGWDGIRDERREGIKAEAEALAERMKRIVEEQKRKAPPTTHPDEDDGCEDCE